MAWPFNQLLGHSPPPQVKPNVIDFPTMKRRQQVFADRLMRRSAAFNKVWTRSTEQPWTDYTDMVRDVLVDLRFGNIKPSGMIIAIVDEDGHEINAVSCWTMGLHRDEAKALCRDMLESFD